MKFLICSGTLYQKEDPNLSLFLNNISKERKNDCFIPQMNAVLDVPIDVANKEELEKLLDSPYKEHIIFVIDITNACAFVFNNFDIEVTKNYCLPRFLRLYERYTRKKSPLIRLIEVWEKEYQEKVA